MSKPGRKREMSLSQWNENKIPEHLARAPAPWFATFIIFLRIHV